MCRKGAAFGTSLQQDKMIVRCEPYSSPHIVRHRSSVSPSWVRISAYGFVCNWDEQSLYRHSVVGLEVAWEAQALCFFQDKCPTMGVEPTSSRSYARTTWTLVHIFSVYFNRKSESLGHPYISRPETSCIESQAEWCSRVGFQQHRV